MPVLFYANEKLLAKIVNFDEQAAKQLANEEGGYVCLKCESSFSLDDEMDPSPLCHGCAHELVSELAKEVLRSRRQSTGVRRKR